MTALRTSAWVGAVLVAGLSLTSGCTGSVTVPPPPTAGFRLVAFDSCEQAAEQLRAATAEAALPWGLPDPMMGEMFAGAERAVPDAAAAPPAADAMRQAVPDFGQTATSHSGTNVHEAGVDEPDLVKTDGRRIVTVTGGVLRVVDAQRRVQTGALALSGDRAPEQLRPGGQPADLLLHGDRVLVLFSGGWAGMPMPERIDDGGPMPVEPARWPVAGPKLLLVDIAGAPRIVSEFTVDGTLLDGRAVGPTARIVVRSTPRLAFPQPGPDSSEAQQLAAVRAAIAETDIAAWLPRYESTTGDTTTTGRVDCTAMSHPERFSGTSMLTVLTFDLAATGLGDGDPVSVVADGDTVYSDGDSLYIASDQRWRIQSVEPDGPGDDRAVPAQRTEIHKFDLSGAGTPRYTGSGAVPGWLVNQYAMSEWEEHLRVATTTGQAWGDEADSESAVYVLAERDDSLVEVGAVGGLGHTERIYAVRFAGPVGYVVTFRETDPLYTLDLSRPAAPAVLGELKITGYSAYLHPIDGDRLIGVGQEADQQGVTQGTQVSLFEVSDLSRPSRLAAYHVTGAHSEAEFDPHAFLWWPEEQLMVIPLTRHLRAVPDSGAPGSGAPSSDAPDSGALLLRVDGDNLAEVGTISHPAPAGTEWAGMIRRSLVIGDTLWTMSDRGLQANALSTTAQLAWIPFQD